MIHLELYLAGEERAGCFAWFVFLGSCDGCVALPHGALGLSLRYVIVVFPDHTHLLFLRYAGYLVLSLWSMDRLRNRQNIIWIKHMYNETIIQPPETYGTIYGLGRACGGRDIRPTFRGQVC